MIDFETWWNSSSADEFRRLNDDMDGRVVRPVWDAAIRATLSSQKATSAAPSPEASQPTQAETASVTTSQTVDELIAYAAQERERDAKWQQWVERGGYDGDQQAEAPSGRTGPVQDNRTARDRAGWTYDAEYGDDRDGWYPNKQAEASAQGACRYPLCNCAVDPRSMNGCAALATQQAVQGEAVLPRPGSPEASAMIDSLLAEYQWPSNPKNAARAGFEAARRMLATPPAPGQVERDVLNEEWAARKLGFVEGVHFGTGAKLQLSEYSQFNKDRIALVLLGARAARSSEGGGNEHSR